MKDGIVYNMTLRSDIMKIKYQDNICTFYNIKKENNIKELYIFEVILQNKLYKYTISKYNYESRLYFKSTDNFSNDFSTSGSIKIPENNKKDNWQQFCYNLIAEIIFHNISNNDYKILYKKNHLNSYGFIIKENNHYQVYLFEGTSFSINGSSIQDANMNFGQMIVYEDRYSWIKNI